MGRHNLLERASPRELVRVTAAVGGLHAQVMSSAELSLWARIEGLELRTVHEALWERRELVKLRAMRGTLHLLPAAELGLWLSALGTYARDGNARPEMDELVDAVGRALDGRFLTREELAAEVEQKTGNPTFGDWVRFSWGSYLKPASYRGLICFAPSEGGRVRFTTPATWVGDDLDKPDPAEALREVARRYLSAYAPLAPIDLGRWWGVTPARAAQMLEALGDEAVEVDVEGEALWVAAHDVEELSRAESPDVVRLLPGFDQWVVGGSRDVSALIASRHRARVYRAQGWISPVVLVNGRMLGVWRHTRKGRQRLLVEIEPFGKLPRWAVAGVEAEAERLAGFLERELVFRYPAKVANRRA
jgi:Winged helix DNA-binding domain